MSELLSLVFSLTVLFISLLIMVIPLWKICKRAGFGGPTSLLILVPVFGWIIVGYILSFRPWPVLMEKGR